MNNLKDFFVQKMPFLGKPKRFLYAFKDVVLNNKQSYSQHGEDSLIYDLLVKNNINRGFYVDVGANHPTTISNTYLLYKKGFRGVIIEPNPELIRLFKIFRKKDLTLMIGCGEATSILPFHISNTPVLSSFENTIGTVANLYLPVMRLDDALSNIEADVIDFLNIDVEGMNLKVLNGAINTIAKTRIACIEFDNDIEKEQIIKVMANTHKLYRTLSCNLIFTRNDL